MLTAAMVFSLIVYVGNSGGVTSNVIADYGTPEQCEEHKKVVEEQFKQSTFRMTAVCVSVPSFTN
jgi:hypothetical protein